MTRPSSAPLPIDAVARDVIGALRSDGVVVVVAPPGTGKTTRLPLLLRPLLAGRKMVVTEPRRLAARSAAERMADALDERVGQTVGYRIRDDTKVSAHTEIEVVTEGVLLRMLTGDQTLDGIGMVILDEVHERHVDTDLALALLIDIRAVLRPDLLLVVMSATLDDDRFSVLLDAPVVSCTSELHPVDVQWAPALLAELPVRAAAAAADSMRAYEGDALVFAPGAAEIRAIGRALDRSGLPADIDVRVLHGSAPVAEQRAAIRGPAPGRRTIVLSTAIAQTSLTVPGVRIVIDCGLERRTRFDPDTGLTRLVTERCSQSTAVQRSGRAGRLGPGAGVRLWSPTEYQRSPVHDEPEILRVDLAALALRLAAVGIGQPRSLDWLDPPSPQSWDRAVATLASLGLVDSGALTPLGREADHLGIEPRLAALLLRARGHGSGLFRETSVACAILDDADVLRRSDRTEGLSELIKSCLAGDVGFADIERRAKRFRDLASGRSTRDPESARPDAQPPRVGTVTLARLLSEVFPERIAVRDASNASRYTLTSGVVATTDPSGPLAGERYLAVVDIDGDRRSGTIRSALPLTLDEIESSHGGALRTQRSVVAERTPGGLTVTVLSSTLLGRAPLHTGSEPPSRSEVSAAIASALNDPDVLRSLLERPVTIALRARMALAGESAVDLPDWSSEALTLDGTFAAALAETLSHSVTTRGHRAEAVLDDVTIARFLSSMLSHHERRELDRHAPTTIALANGRTLQITYEPDERGDGGGAADERAVRACAQARVQDLFGLGNGPSVADGRIPVVLTLLSPAGRPTAVTSDLAAFWASGYRQVRADLRGRYPKHPWPENPADAEPPAARRR